MNRLTQLQLEDKTKKDMINQAKKLFEESRGNGSLGEQGVFKSIIKQFAGKLREELELYVAETEAGVAKIKPIQIKPIVQLGADLVAYEAISALFVQSKVTSHYTVNAYSHHLGSRLEMLHDINRLEQSQDKDDNEVSKQIQRILKRSSYTGDRKDKLVRNLISKYGTLADDIPKDNFTVVARFCLDVISHISFKYSDGMVRKLVNINSFKGLTNGKRKLTSYLRLENWVISGALEMFEEGYFLNNIYKPLVEVPMDHSVDSLKGGGFHSDYFKYSVVQSYFKEKSTPSEQTIKAINILQKVPYRINKKVLEVYKYLVDQGIERAGLSVPVEVHKIPELSRLAEIKERDEEQERNYRTLRKAQADYYRVGTSAQSRVLTQFRILKDAEEFADYDEIFFAYYFDYRGRLYTKTSNLSTQGADYSKALIEFSIGKSINDEWGKLYLCVHGANTYGNDKMSESEKYQWVQDNVELINNIANDPIEHLESWVSTDEPFGFLAFCFDYAGFLKDPDNYKSHLSVALDGSCNGLQHLSAMKLDEVGGAEVNLVPKLEKADIYSSVATDLQSSLIDLQSSTDLAKKILEFPVISDTKKRRKLAKKPTMTFAYASTLDNCLKNTRMIFTENGGVQYFGEDFNEVVKIVGMNLWNSVGNKIVKGAEIMEYLKKVCRILLKNDVSKISWTTPLGFKVVQKRPQEDTKLLSVSLRKGRTRIRTRKMLDKLSNKNVAAIAPNFIHSLDASHLQATVNKCNDRGIENFVMIHDSFGTHASDTKALADTLREEFINIYLEKDVLKGFLDEQDWFLEEQLNKKKIVMPENGKLNLRNVMDSEYFFS